MGWGSNCLCLILCVLLVLLRVVLTELPFKVICYCSNAENAASFICCLHWTACCRIYYVNGALHSAVRRRIVADCWVDRRSAQAWNVPLVIWCSSSCLVVVNLPEFISVTLYTFFVCVLKFFCHRISIQGTSSAASWLAVERFLKMQTWNTVDVTLCTLQVLLL